MPTIVYPLSPRMAAGLAAIEQHKKLWRVHTGYGPQPGAAALVDHDIAEHLVARGLARRDAAAGTLVATAPHPSSTQPGKTR